MSSLGDLLFAKLLDKKMTDCEFEFPKEGGQKTLKANTHVLGAVSPVFYAMFFGESKEKSPIQIPDVPFEVFQKFIHLIYEQKVQLRSIDEAIAFYYTGEKYNIPKAVELARAYIKANFNDSYKEKVYQYAVKYTDKVLAQTAFQGFHKPIHEIMHTSQFFSGTETLESKEFKIAPLQASAVKTELKKYRTEREKILDPKEYIERSLGLVRYLVSEIKNELEFLAPETIATFECSYKAHVNQSPIHFIRANNSSIEVDDDFVESISCLLSES